MPKYKFADLVYNITEKRLPVAGDEVFYIGLEHLDSGKLKVTRWGSKVAIKGEKLAMKKGDILFGRRNTYLRRVAIAPHDGIFSAHGMIFRPKKEVINEDFFPFFIASDYFMDEAIRISVGSLSPTVNWGELKELEFEIPSLEKQKELAKILVAANQTKENYEELLLKTDELVKSQFIEMFGDPILNTMNWDTKSIKEVAPEYTPSVPQQEKYWWLNLDMIESFSGNIIEKIIVPFNKIGSSTSAFDDTMVLYSKLRPYLNKVTIPTEYGYATTELVGLRPKIDIMRKEFLFSLLRGDEFVTYANNVSGGSQMPRMPMKNLREFQCILPPIDLQDKYIDFVRQTDKSKFELKKAIENINVLIKSLMQKDYNN